MAHPATSSSSTIPIGRDREPDSTTLADSLSQLVAPADWRNPVPAERYDLVVLGGGTAGLVCAAGAAGLGARVALVERDRLGGDCLNTGCVPSKALLRSARVVGEFRRAAALGVVSDARVDFAVVMARMRQRQLEIARNDSAERFRSLGVDVFFGEARFVDAESVLVNDARLRFRRAVIATGGRPAIPPVPGLAAAQPYTSETIFDLTDLPPRLLIVGGGPIGCELAQAFARFGASVSVVDRAPSILPREDADAAAVVRRSLEADGIAFVLGVSLEECSRSPEGWRLRYRRESETVPGHVAGDAVIVAAGRTPNIDHLHLDAAGIAATAQGVTVDDRLRTTNARVYASGDVCSAYKFTHAADALSRIVVQNALFFGRKRADALVIPWVTYTDPELAHVGVTSAEADEAGAGLQTITIPLSDIDRAVIDDETDGFVRVHHARGRLRGCTIVAPHAGEMIAEVSYAMTHGGSVTDLSATIHPYPTYGEAFRKAGDAYRRQQLTPLVRRWLERYFRWTR